MSVTPSRASSVLAALCAVALLAGCNSGATSEQAQAPRQSGGAQPAAKPSHSAKPVIPAAHVKGNVTRGATDVPVDRVVKFSTADGTFDSVAVTTKSGKLTGAMADDKKSWTAGTLLEPDTWYTVSTKTTSDQGRTTSSTSRFRSAALTLDDQTYPSFFPVDGQTVGIGQPVIIRFDVPVTDKASIERHLHVTSSPAQRGSWHWISDNEVHWRPAHYWKAGTTVTVHADINSIPAGNGIFGQLDREMTFHIGDAHVYKVNIATDQLRAYSNGRLLRTIPITTGQQPDFTTRSGIKVIVEKKRHTRMNSETIGIDPNSPNGYDLDDVEYAMRITYSGEFLHAAPWSVASQGHENVSHGCTGMSTANAGWLYNLSNVGDVVEYTGSDKPMTLTNGFGDWNESFATYRQGSALH